MYLKTRRDRWSRHYESEIPNLKSIMSSNPRVILTGFADEAANQKTAVQQFSAFAALGLQYYSIRFIDVGGGIKNVMQLTKSEPMGADARSQTSIGRSRRESNALRASVMAERRVSPRH